MDKYSASGTVENGKLGYDHESGEEIRENRLDRADTATSIELPTARGFPLNISTKMVWAVLQL